MASNLIHHSLNFFNLIFHSAQIYSVVNGVAHVVIWAKKVNINEILIEKELADCCEENYMSKVREASEMELAQNGTHAITHHEFGCLQANRWRRQHKQSMRNYQSDGDDDYEFESQEMLDDVPDVEAPPMRSCNQEINLRGPFSPLETTLYSTMRSGIAKSITVDALSVNSIMLDNDLHVRLKSRPPINIIPSAVIISSE